MGFFSDLFGDDSKAYNKYKDELAGLAQSYNPYVQGGKQMFGDLMKQGQWMTSSPWALEDEMQKHYQQSPGFQYAQNQIQQRMNNQAAASGMLGSGAEQKSLQDALTGHLQQDMGQYVDRGINTYNQGLGTEGNLNNMGFNALGAQNQLMQGSYGAGLQGDISHRNAMSHMLGFGLNLGKDFLFGGQGSLGDAMGGMGNAVGSWIGSLL